MIERLPGLTVMVNVRVAEEWVVSLNPTVNVEAPALVGAPLMTPLDASNVNPLGGDPDAIEKL